jgi:hypothetical protein
MSHFVYADSESLQPNRETKMPPWHVLHSGENGRKGEGRDEIDEDKPQSERREAASLPLAVVEVAGSHFADGRRNPIRCVGHRTR